MQITKREITTSFKCLIAVATLSFAAACSRTANQPNGPTAKLEIAARFAYPIGETEMVTAIRDEDAWTRALDFGAQDSLGEHWTVNDGQNKACGEKVYAAANGNVIYAEFAGPEWGLVMIVEHQLPSGEKVQTLYGNLFDIAVDSGPVKMRQEIGHVGNANGRYLCRLHFEVRTPKSTAWNKPGPINSADKTGWLNPTDFIESHR